MFDTFQYQPVTRDQRKKPPRDFFFVFDSHWKYLETIFFKHTVSINFLEMFVCKVRTCNMALIPMNIVNFSKEML